jgi:heat shock protein HslJ
MRFIRTRWQWMISGVCALFLMAACGAPPLTGGTGEPAPEQTPGGTTITNLDGTEWRLVEYGSPEAPTAALEQTEVTARFEAPDRMNGSAGCNSYFATVELDGESFVTSDIGSTLMACADQAVGQQETAYLEALRQANTLQRDGDELRIGYQGGTLRFERMEPAAPAQLEGTTWELVSFVTEGAASSALAGSTVTVEFAGGQLSGSGGCNSYGGGYTLDGDDITVSEIVMTEMACMDEAVMAQEQAFLNNLRAATSVAVEGNELRIQHPGGALVFRAAQA